MLIIELTAEGEALKERAVEIPPKIGCCVQLTGDEAVELHRLLYKVLGGM